MVVVAILLVRKAFEVKEIWAVIQDLFTIYDFGVIHHSRKNVKRGWFEPPRRTPSTSFFIIGKRM
jgi:hypothetical protein